MALCARHEIVRSGGVGDLQKGERFGPFLFLIVTIDTNR